jgi:3-isopropylmalate/(R)-2-methylmalate dehydratase small subunit
VYGDNVDTDRIIPGKYTKTLDQSQLAAHVLEDLDPQFSSRVQEGDIVVAGENFGCGSSREQAPVALKAAGVSVVVAGYFARIFYRNAINIGLPVVEIGEHEITAGHEVQVDLSSGVVQDLTAGRRYEATKMPQVMVDILQAGGLVPYLREHGDYV